MRARGMEWRRTYLDRQYTKANGRVKMSAVESVAKGRAARAKVVSKGGEGGKGQQGQGGAARAGRGRAVRARAARVRVRGME